jgi:hypothetical protein
MAAPIHEQYAEVDDLAHGYDYKHRVLEIIGISLFFAFEMLLGLNLWPTVSGNWLWVLLASVTGYLAADLISGFVHWGGDTWGKPTWWLVGRNFIRPFRHHHVDPKAITRHDFIATNGNNCMTTLIGLVPAAFIPVLEHQSFRVYGLAFIFFCTLGIFATNQFHKWAHMEDPGPTVRVLQRLGLILSPDHHSVHHRAPYSTHYCITTGWLNAPLRAIGFFATLEYWIQRVTGAPPRADEASRYT